MTLRFSPASSSNDRSSYKGPVANRLRLPVSTISTTTFRQIATRRRYRAADKITAAEVWWAMFTGTSESVANATGTIKASIEYPIGTFTQLTFDTGAASHTMTGAEAFLKSDLVTLATAIPQGAAFWVTTYLALNTGLNQPRHQDGMIGALGTAAREYAVWSGTTLTDPTAGAAPGGGNMNNVDTFGPCAILGMTQRPTVFLAGDSMCQGQLTYTTWLDADALQGVTEQIVGLDLGYINGGTGSDAYALANANYTNRLALSALCTHIIDEYGVNDAYANNAATELAAFTTFRAKFPTTKPYYKTTVIPKVTGAWNLADGSDQTTVTGWSNCSAWNDLIRQGLNGLIDAPIDLEAIASPWPGTGLVQPAQRVVTDAGITSGANTITSTAAKFTAADVNKMVAIVGAGASGVLLIGRLGTVTNATTATLVGSTGTALNAGTTVAGATMGIGISTHDGTHQTRLREQAIRDSRTIAATIGLIRSSRT